MSASISPTRWPARAIAAARFAETVDFPTPPLPLEIASTLPRPGSSSGVGGGGGAGGAGGAGVHLAGRRRGAPAAPPASRVFTSAARAVLPPAADLVSRASDAHSTHRPERDFDRPAADVPNQQRQFHAGDRPRKLDDAIEVVRGRFVSPQRIRRHAPPREPDILLDH